MQHDPKNIIDVSVKSVNLYSPLHFIHELIIRKNESSNCCCKQYDIYICIPAWVMSGFFKITVYFVILKMLDKITLKTFTSTSKKTELDRNFMTTLHVNSLFIAHAGMQR